MILFHATTRDRLPSIREHGLLCCMSQGAREVVWLHTRTRQEWAILHTVRRHGGRVEDVVVLPVGPIHYNVRRFRRCLWTSLVDVPPHAIGKEISFSEISRSPCE